MSSELAGSFSWEIAFAAQAACVLEADAPKPGNVNRHHDFDDATLEDFHLSGLAIGRPLGCVAALGVGKTVLEALRATRQCTSTNTNLGILLLLAPLGLAWSRIRGGQGSVCAKELPGLWKNEMRRVLDNLTAEDTAHVYQAIRLASPGGLGEAAEYDVNRDAPQVTLLETMRAAADRDLIARQYADGFSLVLGEGQDTFAAALEKGAALPDAITETFIFLLSRHPDTLIARKLGSQRSEEVQRLAQRVRAGSLNIQEFDRLLRAEKHALNPGATADLTAAIIFVRLLEENIHGTLFMRDTN